VGQYLGRRTLHSAISLIGLIVLVFVLVRLTGDPTHLFLPLDASVEAREAFAEKHGFNDSTIEQTTYPDAAFGEPDGRSTMELRDGRIRKLRDGAVESVITRLSGDTLRFERVPARDFGYTWFRVDDDTWRAVLERPGGAEPVVYTLRRYVADPGFDEVHVRAVLQLLPAAARDGARILARTDDRFVAIREGSNGWTCWVERFGERMGGNCHHTVLDGFLQRKRELSSRPIEGETREETLAREYRTGRLAIPDGALERSGYGLSAEDGGPPEVLSGRYFLYHPFATPAELGVPAEEPSPGAPWLHEAGTVTAHLMWSHTVPVATAEPSSPR